MEESRGIKGRDKRWGHQQGGAYVVGSETAGMEPKARMDWYVVVG
jgi:hypothetical protein